MTLFDYEILSLLLLISCYCQCKIWQIEDKFKGNKTLAEAELVAMKYLMEHQDH